MNIWAEAGVSRAEILKGNRTLMFSILPLWWISSALGLDHFRDIQKKKNNLFPINATFFTMDSVTQNYKHCSTDSYTNNLRINKEPKCSANES